MFINEYGDKGDPVVVLLAPMMISGSDLYENMSPYFRGSYHIIAPDQGGHGKAGAYVSADEEYRTLKAFLLDNGYTEIELVYGASLGAAVAWRLFLDPAFDVKHAWLDGVALVKEAGVTEKLVAGMFRRWKKKSARRTGKPSGTLVKMYGPEFEAMMSKNFRRITDSDIDAICRACCHYDLKKLTDEQQARLHLDYGEKDFDLKMSRKSIPAYMPKAEVKIRPGYAHCGYMAAHPKAYAEEMEAFMTKEKTDE